MNKSIELNIEIPGIFPKNEIISGVTRKNEFLFPEHGLTFSYKTSANHEYVNQCRSLLADYLQTEPNKVKYQHQTHSDIIRVIDENSIEETGDGMITNVPGLTLCVKTADCAAILMYDPMNNAIGAVHSGWKGTYQKIAVKTIEKMSFKYGSVPSNLLAYISPAASCDNYEVGSEFAEMFPKSVVPKNFRRFGNFGSIEEICNLDKDKNKKYLFDNKKEILQQLLDSGVKPENIEVSPICTIDNIDFHSYRRDGEKSGRMGAFIQLRIEN